jgi:hypothetical protein
VPVLALAIFLVYLVYQAKQEEDIVTTTIDFVEFLLGFSVGIVLSRVAW